MAFRKKQKNLDRQPGLVLLGEPLSVLAEQFQTIKTNLQFSMVDKTLDSFVITSATPESGKSLLASNLALAFADIDTKVLLVDSDLRKPTVHRTFELPNHKGLSTLITMENEILEASITEIYDTNLFVLTSGPIPPNPINMLNSDRMKELITEMKENFDVVIFDAPPVLAVSDALVVGQRTDGIVFTVPIGNTTKEQILEAARNINNTKAQVLGTVYNRVDPSNDNYYYYYSE